MPHKKFKWSQSVRDMGAKTNLVYVWCSLRSFFFIKLQSALSDQHPNTSFLKRTGFMVPYGWFRLHRSMPTSWGGWTCSPVWGPKPQWQIYQHYKGENCPSVRGAWWVWASHFNLSSKENHSSLWAMKRSIVTVDSACCSVLSRNWSTKKYPSLTRQLHRNNKHAAASA